MTASQQHTDIPGPGYSAQIFPGTLTDFLRDADLSRPQLAKILGVTDRTVYRWILEGDKLPPLVRYALTGILAIRHP